MKLKKIVSLAAAALMAVSMLTACGEGASSTPVVPPDDEDTNTTSYSAVLQSELEDLGIKKIKFADSTELDNALKTAVEHAGYDSITNDFIHSLFGNGSSMRWVGRYTSSAAFQQVNNKLRDAMDPEVEMQDSASETIRLVSPESAENTANSGALYSKGEVNTTILFVADRGMDLEAVMDEIADMIQDGVKGLNTTYDHIDVNGTTYTYEYTGSVSVCSKNFDEMHGIGVNFIAVNVVRTIAY